MLPLTVNLTAAATTQCKFRVFACENFPSFLPKQVHSIKDPFARKFASRIQRLPVDVSFAEHSIMSSCVKPLNQNQKSPLVLLHGFNSSCLEWTYVYPMLEDAGLEAWAIDILGWGFSDLEKRPSCDVIAKRDHMYQLWRSYIKRPMILVGPSLGAACAIDFTIKYPEAVEKLVLIDASVYAKGTLDLAAFPKAAAYAGVFVLKSVLLRYYGTLLACKNASIDTRLDWMNVGGLHCLLPWWEDATVDFMLSGGYDVSGLIKQVTQKALIIWGEDDQIISNKTAVRLHCELPNAIIRQIPDCGHLPHVEKPSTVAKLILEFVQGDSYTSKEAQPLPCRQPCHLALFKKENTNHP